MPDESKDEEKTEGDAEENLSDQLRTDDEGDEKVADAEGKKDGDEGEKKTDEDEGESKDDDSVDLPDLTPEQIAALAQDPRIAEARQGEDKSALDRLLEDSLAEREQERERKESEAKQEADVDSALKAYEEGDPAPLAELAAKGVAQARKQREITSALDGAVSDRIADDIRKVFGDTLKDMKPEEVKALDDMPLADALSRLVEIKAAAGKAESQEQLSEAEKAARNAKAAADARNDDNGSLPGGTAKEGAAGDDIGALIREGMVGAMSDVEE
jgi:hypothetical protein